MNYKDINTYDYDLDESLIAQTPIKERDHSKLLVVNKNNGNFKDEHFYNIIDYLHKGDVLVLNNTKVLPSRIIGYKIDTKAKIEVLLLKEIESDIWECLVRPQKRVKIGTRIHFEDDFECEVLEVLNDGITHVKFDYKGIFVEHLNSIGAMPLPPYIHEKLKDNDRYNTVYAKNIGSAAAPTAGLHFTNELLEKLKDKGIEILYVTLNVGLGTFRPVVENDITKHDMHKELYDISDDVANKLNKAKEENRRIICVGTTSLRTLEANISKYNKFKSTVEETGIFIYPPYKFKSADALITNFHLPKSTLVMLVSAFSSVDIIMNAYKHAQDEKYKFFSFGDAMFLTDEEVK
ncbi:MAG: tRNA preQ1(34) S-adenosylmethionine ribosyltransferase-isomerase QueA [Bacilli bacterium]|nr:tRNA preQ1(34) S-adenosylmethionine ribosyltransferase-isomerase QueA [Bacilli bacterium]